MVIHEKKFKDETLENIQELFQYLFMLVGLKSVPNQIETVFLLQEIKAEYGNHSINEIKLAFKKAIKGELRLEQKEVRPFENFSMLYFSTIMNAYREWSTLEYRRLEYLIPPSTEQDKFLEGPRPEKNFKMELEQAYHHFLLFGTEHQKLFPAEFYNQLETDGAFKKDLYKLFLKAERKKLISELEKEKTAIVFGVNTLKGERFQVAEMVRETNMRIAQEKIDKYKSGENDAEIVLSAKQYCVMQYFIELNQEGKKTIYVSK